jgi:hypothetical protein
MRLKNQATILLSMVILFGNCAKTDKKEVIMAGKVKHENDSVYVDGMQQAFWGGTSEKQNSVIGSLWAALNAIGDSVSYNYLMGTGGSAFLLQMRWCASSPHALCGRNCLNPALKSMGYTVEFINTFDHKQQKADTNGIERAKLAIKTSIDAGIPVLFSKEECGLIVGYINGGETFLERPYSAEFTKNSIGYRTMENWPWDIGIITKTGNKINENEALKTSIAAAIEMVQTEKYGDYLSGFNAFEVWANDLEDASRFSTMNNANWFGTALANGYTYGCLSSARQSAAEYLKESIQSQNINSFHLAEAQKIYEKMHKTLMTEHGGLKCAWSIMPWDLKTYENWTPELRQTQANILRDILQLERKAIQELNLALKELG